MIDATGRDTLTLLLKQRLRRWLVPWRRFWDRGVEEGGVESRLSLRRCRGCVRDGFCVIEELWSGTSCHEFFSASTKHGKKRGEWLQDT